MTDLPKIRLFCTHPLSDNAPIPLDLKQNHYLQHVMRKKMGDAIIVFNGQDGEWLATLDHLAKKSGSATAIRQLRPQQNEPDVWLVFAPVKNVALHFLAQKSTELGASALVPVITDHTIVSRVNTDKLHANAIEAAEQCERLTVPTIHASQRLDQFLSSLPPERTLIFCDESGQGKPIIEALSSQPEHASYAILIGPEGGFSSRELEMLHSHPHIVPVGLGPRILRADTAALSALACFQACCGDGDTTPRLNQV